MFANFWMQKKITTDNSYTMYLGTGLYGNGLVRKSIDAGVNWTSVLDFQTRILAFLEGGGVMLAAREYGFVQYSTDSGANWTELTINEGKDIKYVDGVYYLAAGGGNADGLYTSSNGTTWTKNNGIATACYSVFVSGDNIYVGGYDGLYISTNGGTSFSKKVFADGLGSDTVRSVLVAGSTIWAGTLGGVSKSTNGGTSFTNYTTTEGLAANGITRICYDPDGNIIYAVAFDTDAGLSYSSNGGTTWTIVDLTLIRLFGGQYLGGLAYVNGRMWVSGVGYDYDATMAYSDDDGANWSYLQSSDIGIIDSQGVASGNVIFIN
jgi:hypothetical protein